MAGRRRGDRWLVRGRIGPKLATKTPGAQAITKLQRGESYSCVKNKESVTANLYGRRRKSGKTPHRSAAPGHVTHIPARGRFVVWRCARDNPRSTAGDFFRAAHKKARGTGDPRSPALKIRLAAHRIKIGLELRHAVNFFYLVTPKTINQRTRRLQSPPNLRLN